MYLTIAKVCERYPSTRECGHISKPTIYAWIKNHNFPKPVKLGGRISYWDSEQVEAWEVKHKGEVAKSDISPDASNVRSKEKEEPASIFSSFTIIQNSKEDRKKKPGSGLRLIIGNNRFTIEVATDFSQVTLERLIKTLEKIDRTTKQSRQRNGNNSIVKKG